MFEIVAACSETKFIFLLLMRWPSKRGCWPSASPKQMHVEQFLKTFPVLADGPNHTLQQHALPHVFGAFHVVQFHSNMQFEVRKNLVLCKRYVKPTLAFNTHRGRCGLWMWKSLMRWSNRGAVGHAALVSCCVCTACRILVHASMSRRDVGFSQVKTFPAVFWCAESEYERESSHTGLLLL